MTTSDMEQDTVLRIVRVFKAPRRKVFEAFTDPEILRSWWCPDGFTFTDVTIDPESGLGKRFTMVDESTGGRYVWDIDYTEVEKPHRIKWISTWVEGFAGGNGQETVATLEFREVGGGTELTLTHEGFPDKETRDGHAGGWGGSLDKLAGLIAGS